MRFVVHANMRAAYGDPEKLFVLRQQAWRVIVGDNFVGPSCVGSYAVLTFGFVNPSHLTLAKCSTRSLVFLICWPYCLLSSFATSYSRNLHGPFCSLQALTYKQKHLLTLPLISYTTECSKQNFHELFIMAAFPSGLSLTRSVVGCVRDRILVIKLNVFTFGVRLPLVSSLQVIGLLIHLVIACPIYFHSRAKLCWSSLLAYQSIIL